MNELFDVPDLDLSATTSVDTPIILAVLWVIFGVDRPSTCADLGVIVGDSAARVAFSFLSRGELTQRVPGGRRERREWRERRERRERRGWWSVRPGHC